MSRRNHGKLAPLTAEDRAKKIARNQRRGRPRFIIKMVKREIPGTRRRPGRVVHDRFRVAVNS